MSNGNEPKSEEKRGLERFTEGVKALGVAFKSWGPIGFGILALITFGFFMYGLVGGGALLNNLMQTETARGLITFLVVLTTVSIGIILVIFAVASENQQGDSFKERFTLGKEVLTALIGILGTIIGFYFGTDVTKKEPVKQQMLQVAPARISDVKPKQGEKIRLTSYVNGGTAPYKYDIIFAPPDKLEPIKNKVSMDGYIEEEIKIPEGLPVNTKLTFKIDIMDKNEKKATLDEKTKEILVREK